MYTLQGLGGWWQKEEAEIIGTRNTPVTAEKTSAMHVVHIPWRTLANVGFHAPPVYAAALRLCDPLAPDGTILY